MGVKSPGRNNKTNMTKNSLPTNVEFECAFRKIVSMRILLNSNQSPQSFVDDFIEHYRVIDKLYKKPVFRCSVLLAEWMLIKNLLQNDGYHGRIGRAGTAVILASKTDLFRNFEERVKHCSSLTQESIDYSKKIGSYVSSYLHNLRTHPLQYLFNISNMTLGNFQTAFLIHAYSPQAISGQKLLLNSILGIPYFERKSRGGVINMLRKTFSDSGLINAYLEEGLSTDYSLDEHIEEIKHDMSWINASPYKARVAILKGNWSPEELKNEGIDLNHMAMHLNDTDACFKTKNTMVVQAKLLLPLFSHLNNEQREKSEQVLSRIIESCPHHLLSEDILSAQIDIVLASKYATPSQKLAATMGSILIGKEVPEGDFSGMTRTDMTKVMRKVLGPEYQKSPNKAVRIMTALNLNKKTKSFSKVMRKGLMVDLGL